MICIFASVVVDLVINALCIIASKKVQMFSIEIKINLIYWGDMDRKTLMDEVAKAAFDRRIELNALFKTAKVSPSIAYRYTKQGIPPTLPTIGKLEKALADIDQQAPTQSVSTHSPTGS